MITEEAEDIVTSSGNDSNYSGDDEYDEFLTENKEGPHRHQKQHTHINKKRNAFLKQQQQQQQQQQQRQNMVSGVKARKGNDDTTPYKNHNSNRYILEDEDGMMNVEYYQPQQTG